MIQSSRGLSFPEIVQNGTGCSKRHSESLTSESIKGPDLKLVLQHTSGLF
jgi:hypothetical protein